MGQKVWNINSKLLSAETDFLIRSCIKSRLDRTRNETIRNKTETKLTKTAETAQVSDLETQKEWKNIDDHVYFLYVKSCLSRVCTFLSMLELLLQVLIEKPSIQNN